MDRNYPCLRFKKTIRFFNILIRVGLIAPPTSDISPPYENRFCLRVRRSPAHRGHPTVLCFNNKFPEP